MGVRRRSWLIALVSLLCIDMAQARGPWRASDGNTTGWHLMTPEERVAHQARIRGFTSYEACHAYRQEHHQLMVARASEKGLAAPAGRRDFCDHLRQPAPRR